MNARITPEGSLEVLSRYEVSLLKDKSKKGLYDIFRQCALAVLNCGNESDDCKAIMERYKEFDIKLVNQPRGIKLELTNAPASAFVDGEMIKGIKEHLFSALRDIVHAKSVLAKSAELNLDSSSGITNVIFHQLRNAQFFTAGALPNIVVCWGGHSISRQEYDFTKKVGHELGLRGLNICTGCGPGAMKGPMKGATIAHAKQRIHNGRYIGISEPGIIAAESPNPIVNELTILPDIEKRLEAFVRIGHGIIVFPGGVGTAEEILYLLGVLLHPANKKLPFPVFFVGSKENASYFKMIDTFIGGALGEEAQKRYKIIIDDPIRVAKEIKKGIDEVAHYRRVHRDAYYFNWLLKIDPLFQQPFQPTHENMANLQLHRDQPVHLLAANLRRAFSGIVAGNVKDEGVRRVEKFGPFEIHGDKTILDPLEGLLESFIKENRMKLPGKVYTPSYRIIN
ncbi:nucleotide 5'-monophosphate nucleosidase PpnN [Alkalimarinus alittae]|uniref:AMP nucleosidase n=1 Tax=Alkalimarinus alittae TaxID=2961619 RepID=A0ABY6N7P0_9ALTE|nr:nucleotide 5'-monophosphate nucleosidase PpnN [Alkalimarinus alittae]UZE97987.1 nucleotide 5'-monophosphate nucleosidase PpnN [Alkalimarinus alittae]